ncbi:hypothetical protein DY000_02040125 [Brassica cretica]|uniref:Uncharacterized protein n=1 Tax=Brassica cretica TaxID=69181 RepID=A0ABQ7BQP2_BRACR|nr:hypothetical protein DY000_02040125 [Brassica cretica]
MFGLLKETSQEKYQRHANFYSSSQNLLNVFDEFVTVQEMPTLRKPYKVPDRRCKEQSKSSKGEADPKRRLLQFDIQEFFDNFVEEVVKTLKDDNQTHKKSTSTRAPVAEPSLFISKKSKAIVELTVLQPEHPSSLVLSPQVFEEEPLDYPHQGPRLDSIKPLDEDIGPIFDEEDEPGPVFDEETTSITSIAMESHLSFDPGTTLAPLSSEFQENFSVLSIHEKQVQPQKSESIDSSQQLEIYRSIVVQTGYFGNARDRGSVQGEYIDIQKVFYHKSNFPERPSHQGFTESWNRMKIFTEEEVMNFSNQRFSSPSIREYQTSKGDSGPGKNQLEPKPILEFNMDLSASHKDRNQEKWPWNYEVMIHPPKPARPKTAQPFSFSQEPGGTFKTSTNICADESILKLDILCVETNRPWLVLRSLLKNYVVLSFDVILVYNTFFEDYPKSLDHVFDILRIEKPFDYFFIRFDVVSLVVLNEQDKHDHFPRRASNDGRQRTWNYLMKTTSKLQGSTMDLRTSPFKEGGNDVPQSTDQYMEPAQHGTDRVVYWTVPHTSGKELWLEPWPDDRSERTGACLSRSTSQAKADGQTRINLGRANSDSDHSFSLLARLARTACTRDCADDLASLFDPIMDFSFGYFSKARILTLSEDLGHVRTQLVRSERPAAFAEHPAALADRPAPLLILSALDTAISDKSGQEPNRHLD